MSSIRVFAFDEIQNDQRMEHVLFFCGPEKADDVLLSELIERELQHNLEPDYFSIIVIDTRFDETVSSLSDSDLFTSTLDRLRKTTVVQICGFGVDGDVTCQKGLTSEAKTFKIALFDIYRPAITDLFHERGGFVESTSSYHFENPSGRHTDRFIRLSNLLQGSSDIYLIAQACLRFVPGSVSKVWIDTPSLFSIVAAINELRSNFGLLRLEIECFRSYEGYLGIPDQAFKNGDFVLISASSSEGLANKIKSELSVPNERIAHVLYLGRDNPSFSLACDLAFSDSKNPEGIKHFPHTIEANACELCRAGSAIVYLKGEQFDLQGPQPSPVLVKRGSAPNGLSTLMGRLVNYQCLGIRISDGTALHREFYIDTGSLGVAAKFKERFNYILAAKLPAATSHVICVDEHSSVLTSLVDAHLKDNNTSAEVIQVNDIDAINEPSTIVVVVGVIESGRCLTDISRDLRNIAPHTPIIYLVGIDKSSGSNQREKLGSTLVQSPNAIKHEFQAAESICLPSSRSTNSWTKERDLLLNPAFSELAKNNDKIWIEKRLKVLSSTASIRNDLFLDRNCGGSLKLQSGFVFWPKKAVDSDHCQADVYVTVVSILQNLRMRSSSPDAEDALREAWFHQTILDPQNFTRFNDDVLHAAFLRAARPSEMNYRETPDLERSMHRILRRIVDAADKERGGAAPEFVLAVVLNRLRLSEQSREDILTRAVAKGNVLGLLGRFGLSQSAILKS